MHFMMAYGLVLFFDIPISYYSQVYVNSYLIAVN